MHYLRPLPFLLLASLLSLSGCGNNAAAPTTSNEPAQFTPTSSSADTSNEWANETACAIALVAHNGQSPADQEITHWQDLALQAKAPVAYLERLGWAYIAKARVSFDEGFYLLAEQSAVCLDQNRLDQNRLDKKRANPQFHSAEYLLLRGHVLHNLHRFKESEALARKLVKQRGRWFDHGLLGDVLMEQGKIKPAIAAYQAMMDQRPGPQAYSRAAHMRWLTGDLAGATEMMQLAVQASDRRAPEPLAWNRVRLAGYQMQAGAWDKAKTTLKATLALLPDYAPALLARGRLQLAQGQWVQAVDFLRQAERLNPLPQYQWTLLEALQQTGQHEEARGVQKRLLKHGARADARSFALYLASTRHDIPMALDTALSLARKELKTRTDIFTLDALAWTLRAAGQHEKAYHYSQQALREGTQDARLFYHAAIIAHEADRQQEANALFVKATALSPLLLPTERKELTAFRNTPAQALLGAR